MSERIPAQVFCLAELLSDEMVARGWTTTDVALRMGGDEEQFTKDLLALDLLMCVHEDKLLIGDRMFVLSQHRRRVAREPGSAITIHAARIYLRSGQSPRADPCGNLALTKGPT